MLRAKLRARMALRLVSPGARHGPGGSLEHPRPNCLLNPEAARPGCTRQQRHASFSPQEASARPPLTDQQRHRIAEHRAMAQAKETAKQAQDSGPLPPCELAAVTAMVTMSIFHHPYLPYRLEQSGGVGSAWEAPRTRLRGAPLPSTMPGS